MSSVINNTGASAAAASGNDVVTTTRAASSAAADADADARPRNFLYFFMNGAEQRVVNPDPEMTLHDYLRARGTTSVKKACGEGGCGACAVMLSSTSSLDQNGSVPDATNTTDTRASVAADAALNHRAVASCLLPLADVDGCLVTTAEGVGSSAVDGQLHPVQQRLACMHATQCGFCTPGMVMSLYAALADATATNTPATVASMTSACNGNLCRCTGYRPIYEAATSFAVDSDVNVALAAAAANDAKDTACATCPKRNTPACSGACGGGDDASAVVAASSAISALTAASECDPVVKTELSKNGSAHTTTPSSSTTTTTTASAHTPTSLYGPVTVNVALPPQLSDGRRHFERSPLVFRGPSVTWFRPVSLRSLLRVLQPAPAGAPGDTEADRDSSLGDGDGFGIDYVHRRFQFDDNGDVVKQQTSSSSGAAVVIDVADDEKAADAANVADDSAAAVATTIDTTTTAPPHFANELVAGRTRCTMVTASTELVCGNTDLGYQHLYKHRRARLAVSVMGVRVMRGVRAVDGTGITVGAATTVAEFERLCATWIRTQPRHRTRFIESFSQQITYFANRMVRNVGTLGGSLCAADTLSDLYPVWLASNSVVYTARLVRSGNADDNVGIDDDDDSCDADLDADAERGIVRRRIMVRDFVTAPRTTALLPGEVVTHIHTPWSTPSQHVLCRKVSKRRDDCQALVTTCMMVDLRPESSSSDRLKVHDSCLAFGGIAAVPSVATLTQALLQDSIWTPVHSPPSSSSSPSLFQRARATLESDEEFTLSPKLGDARYRLSLLPSLLYKFWTFVSEAVDVMPAHGRTAGVAQAHVQGVKCGQQQFAVPGAPPSSSSEQQQVGRVVPHQSAFLHVSGAAVFTGDLPTPTNGLHGAYVQAPLAHAKFDIDTMDTSMALAIDGVVGVVTARDIPSVGRNALGSLTQDEPVFADGTVMYHGQPVALVVAHTAAAAAEAALAVRVHYTPLTPVVQTIEDAIDCDSFFEGWDREITTGDVDGLLQQHTNAGGAVDDVNAGSNTFVYREEDDIDESEYDADADDDNTVAVVVKGTVRTGSQEHMYLETNTCLVVPTGDKWVVHCASQNPAKMQDAVCTVLGVPLNSVESHVMRVGGSFGGKQDRPAFHVAACAVAARRFGCAVRMTLERSVDMQVSGMRHPYVGNYQLAVTRRGRMLGARIELYTNGGHTLDLTPAQLDRGMWGGENCYRVPHFTITGRCARTHRASNTAFRGFGVPQCVAVMETAVEHAARTLRLAPHTLRTRNLYRAGDVNPTGFKFPTCNVGRCWQQLSRDSAYGRRAAAVRKFNAEHAYVKRGLAVMPCRSSTMFEADFMDAAGALVHVYRDGSVVVSHSGVEMGQGIHTKMAMIAAQTLQIPYELVRTDTTSTDKVPNTHPTAASSGTDLNGWAVVNACKRIRERLQNLFFEFPTASWQEIVDKAYHRKISLSENGYWAAPNFVYDYDTKKGRTSFYFVWCAVMSEVELDCLTGEWRCRYVHLVQDAGNSVNPAIDLGQLEGAFVQGLGLYTMEQPIWARDGHLRTRNVSTYKIPAMSDMPDELRVSLLADAPNNDGGVFKQKTLGEIGVQSAFSVHLALHDAVAAFRADPDVGSDAAATASSASSASPFFRMDVPATVPYIRWLLDVNTYL